MDVVALVGKWNDWEVKRRMSVYAATGKREKVNQLV
jgi:hypothetical protein